MNVVFLDIDGVLNNMGSAMALGSTSRHFDPVSVGLVSRLCREGNASIVISSSWRSGDIGRLLLNMQEAGAGVLQDRVIGETPLLQRRSSIAVPRGEEIREWLHQHGSVYRYVILDDDADMLPGQPFVKTDFVDGFRYRHYQAALRHLAPEHKDCEPLPRPPCPHEWHQAIYEGSHGDVRYYVCSRGCGETAGRPG